MTDILFINPPLNNEKRLGAFASIGSHHPPLNLCYLSAMTERYGYNTKIMDCEILKLDIDKAIEKIPEINPRFIGVTSMTLTIDTAGLLAKRIKFKKPETSIILGGIHLTSLPFETMRAYPDFDVGIIGEGEITIIELLKSLEQKTPLENIKGIIYRQNGTLKITEERPFIKNLDELPFPSFHLLSPLDKNYHPSFQKFKRSPSCLLITSRGCPQKCIFCDFKGLKNTYRSYSVPYIIKLIKKLQADYGIKDINFHDDIFTLPKSKTIEFCNVLLDEKIDLTWSCQARVDHIEPELLKIMKKTGCWSIAFGIETGSQDVLDFIKKGTTIKQNEQAIKWCNEIGIETIGFILIGHPIETKETMRETLNFIKELNLTYVLPLYFTPFPNSDSFEKIEEYGYLKKDWNKFTTFNPVFIPKGLNEIDLINYKKQICQVFYFRINTAVKFLKKILHGYSLRKFFTEGLTLLKILGKK